MANNNQQTTVDKIEFEGEFILDSFKNDQNKEQSFLVCRISTPFPNDPFELDEVRLTAKWDKYDQSGRLVKADAGFAKLKSCAKYELRTAANVPFRCYAKKVKYKLGNEFVTDFGLFIVPPFSVMEDERDVEVMVKGAETSAVFKDIVRKKMGIRFNRNDDPEDIGI